MAQLQGESIDACCASLQLLDVFSEPGDDNVAASVRMCLEEYSRELWSFKCGGVVCLRSSIPPLEQLPAGVQGSIVQCYMAQVDDNFETMFVVRLLDDDRGDLLLTELRAGTSGTVVRIDSEGNALVQWENLQGYGGKRWLNKMNFKRAMRQLDTIDEQLRQQKVEAVCSVATRLLERATIQAK